GVGLEPLLRNLVVSGAFREEATGLYNRWKDARLKGKDDPFSMWPAGLYAAALRPELVESVARWLGGEEIPVGPLRWKIAEVCFPPQRMAVTGYNLPDLIVGLANSLKA